jgi:hypothetical protein
MDSCGIGPNTIIANVGGQKYDLPPPGLLTIELTSVAKTASSGVQMQAIRLIDAGAELSRVRERANKYGGVPVACAIAFRITQNVTIPAVAGATVSRVEAPFSERYALSTVLVAPGKLSDAYFRSVTRNIGPLNDRMYTGIAPVLCSNIMQQMGSAFGQHLNVAGEQSITLTGAPALYQSKPLYNLAPPQTRAVYLGTAGGSEPANGSEYGDLFLFPLTCDGIDGDPMRSGIPLELITDGSGSSYWSWTFTMVNNTGLYHNAGAAVTFGDFTVTPVLVYRIERPAVGPDGVMTVTQGEVWEDRFNLPTTDAVVTPFSAADVMDHSFVGWLPDVIDDNTDSGNRYILRADAGPGVPYDIKLSVIPPSFPPATDLWSNGSYLGLGDGATEQWPNDVNANGATFVNDCNGLNGFQTKQSREGNAPPVGLFAEMHDFGQSGVRTRAFSFCISGITNSGATGLRYGTTWGGGTAVSAFDTTYPGVAQGSVPFATLGGFQFWPIAFCNKNRKGFPGFNVRPVGDTRPIVATKVGSFLTPTRINGGGSVGWRVSLQRTRGVFSQCVNNSKATPGVVPVTFDPSSPKAQLGDLLTTSSAAPLPSSIPSRSGK